MNYGFSSVKRVNYCVDCGADPAFRNQQEFGAIMQKPVCGSCNSAGCENVDHVNIHICCFCAGVDLNEFCQQCLGY